MSNIGNYIKLLRESKNYSQRKLSLISKVSNATINRVESGISMPDPDTLKKLAPALGASYEKFMAIAGYLTGENSANNHNYTTGGNLLLKEEMEAIDLISHIKDKNLRTWITDPSSIDYIVFAKKLSDMGIDPDFVYNEFVSRIMKKNRE